MKSLSLFLIAAFTIFSGEVSMADVCFTDIQQSQNEAAYFYDGSGQVEAQLYQAAMSCQSLDNVSTGLEAASIALSGAALYAACTGVGIPATVTLEGGALALTAINLIVSRLDCERTDSEDLIQKRVDEAVCAALTAQGIDCYPPLQQLRTDLLFEI